MTGEDCPAGLLPLFYIVSMDSPEKALPIILFEDISIFNNGNLIIDSLNMSVNKGEFIYIEGKVGSGKTSIIKSLIGELPVKGKVARVGEFDLLKLKNRKIPYLRRKIGVVFQDFQLLMDRSVYDNLAFVLKATGMSNSRDIDSRIKSVLECVGMSLKAHKMPHQLSGGEQQRIAIARSLLNEPDIILADEPTGNLDDETAEGIMNLLLNINREMGPAVIMVTHNRSIISKFPGKRWLCENCSCNLIREDA